jgi:uncharacterized protein YydD (DUF2326 family)
MDYVTPTHQEILDAVHQANFVVFVNNHKVCETQQYDGYVITPKNPMNESGKNEFVICPDTIQKLYEDWKGEVNRTIAHEALHVAQVCRFNDGYIRPLGFRDDVEKEAYAVQDQPGEVLRIVKKYCL